MTTRLRTAEQVAPELHMHPGSVLRLARQGHIGRTVIGGKVLFSDKHVEDYIAANSQDAQAARRPARASR